MFTRINTRSSAVVSLASDSPKRRGSQRYRLAFGLFLCSFAWLAGSPAPVLAQSEVETSADAPVAEAVAELPAAATSTEAAVDEPTLFEKIDAKFGQYVVAPAGAVIFYDFGTGPKKTEGGLIEKGWLQTPTRPDGVSVPGVVVWLLVAGVFLTLRMGFINIRGFWHAIRLTRGDYDNPDEPGEVSHFQALSAALSATVGLGNIGGVAVAIGLGGPGACFWIIVAGFVGMSTKFAECTLGQLYRRTDENGNILGGPMRYLHVGLKELGLGPIGKGLSILFMVLCIGASFGGGNSYQIGQSLSAIQQDVKFFNPDHGGYPIVYGVIMAVLVGLVIVGGIKSIGAVASRIVPLMCVGYMIAAMFILVSNFSQVPAAIMDIVSQAFDINSIYGGIVGVMVIGIQRAVFSNEAGVGSAAIAHSAAKTDEPVSEGIVALLEPFIDTVVVCTATALVIIVTGVYDAEKFVAQHDAATVIQSLTLPDGAAADDVDAAQSQLAKLVADKDGAAMTLAAFRSGGHHWFGYFLLVAVVMFAYSTCISWSYYGERSWVELFGESTSMIYKGLFLGFTVLGSIVTRGNILDFSDLMILGMSIPNLIGVFLLSGVVKRRLDEYWAKYTSGELDRDAAAERALSEDPSS